MRYVDLYLSCGLKMYFIFAGTKWRIRSRRRQTSGAASAKLVEVDLFLPCGLKMCVHFRRDIMARTEPAMLDMWGGEWTARDEYQPQPTARRYEQYEVAFAAKVCSRALLSREILPITHQHVTAAGSGAAV